MAVRQSNNERLEADLDSRMLKLWIEVHQNEIFQSMSDEQQLYFGTRLRAAYGQAYRDALSEEIRGQLYVDHGYKVPARERRRIPSREILPHVPQKE